MQDKPYTPTKRMYPGFHDCVYHDTLAEMLKSEIPHLCRNCFKVIGKHHIQLLGQALWDLEMLTRRLNRLENALIEEALEANHEETT